MAYKSDDLILQAVSDIEKHKLFFVEDIIDLLPCSKPTFYQHFTRESDELNYLKEKLRYNNVIMKVSIRQKLHKGNNTTALLALYKLICLDEERKNLSQTYMDHSSEDGSMRPIFTVQSKEDIENLKKLSDDN